MSDRPRVHAWNSTATSSAHTDIVDAGIAAWDEGDNAIEGEGDVSPGPGPVPGDAGDLINCFVYWKCNSIVCVRGKSTLGLCVRGVCVVCACAIIPRGLHDFNIQISTLP
jgi:hypothetical protein